jgi:Uncharacterized protein, homolog of phage Mu protein gp30
MAEAGRGYKVPPEVPRYFAERELKPAFSWLDVSGEEHAHAYMVSKVTELDVLVAFFETMKEAFDKGQGYKSWEESIRPELQRLGWWGPRTIIDPTGREPDRLVDFSSPRRLKNIFWSNMRSARAAGQWERIQRTKKALPYLLYVRTTAADPREEHLDWVGIILPVDHPFWTTHFPPNGWGCKCAVRQITAREAERLLATGNYRDTPPENWRDTTPFKNRRTGEVVQVPIGIDPGWVGNPGKAATRARMLYGTLAERIEASQQVTGGGQIIRPQVTRIVSEIAAGPPFAQLYAQAIATYEIRRAAQRLAKDTGLGLAGQDAAAAAAAPWRHAPLPIAVLPVRLDPWRGLRPITVTITDNAIAHSHKAHPTPVAEWKLIQEVLDRGEILHAVEKGGEKLWAFIEKNDQHYMAVLVDKAGGWRALTYFGKITQRYRDKQRAINGRTILMQEEGE